MRRLGTIALIFSLFALVSVLPTGASARVPCQGGVVILGQCTCPPGSTPDPSGICVLQQISCQGGAVVLGRCVCTPGQILQNGICVKKTPCSGGKLDPSTNQCQCPDGAPPQDGKCGAAPPTPAPTPTPCDGGAVDQNGQCLCPQGQVPVNGKCSAPDASPAPPAQVPCEGGAVDQKGQCLCPPDQTAVNGKCTPNNCLGGMIAPDGQCYCPPKTVLKGNKCVALRKSG